MKKKKIEVKRDAVIVNISKKSEDKKYYVKTQVNPQSFDTYEGFSDVPSIRGKVLEVGGHIRAGQVIRG